MDIMNVIRERAKFDSEHRFQSLVFTEVWTPFLIYSSVALTLFLIIFYGTTYQLTPFRILMPFLRKSTFLERASSGLLGALASGGEVGNGSVGDLDIPTYKERDVLQDRKPSVTTQVEVIDDILHEAEQSTTRLAQRMENRINLHLTFGVLTGEVGLAVWYVTFYHTGVSTPVAQTIGGRLLDTLPRITILFFIELLAGFFLRQYRIGVEDLKYFLELRRRAEFKRIAYLIYERINNTEAKMAFAKQLLEERSDTRLSAGETTTTLTAIDKEKNEVLSGLQTLASSIQSITKELKDAKNV